MIWSASSRVGASTSALGLCGPARPALATSGIPKASVFPDPVGARPQMSCPAKASARTAAWISKGSVMPPRREGAVYGFWNAQLGEGGGTLVLLARVMQANNRVRLRLRNQEAWRMSRVWFTMTGRTSARLRTRQPDVPAGYPQANGACAAILSRRSRDPRARGRP